MIELILSSSQTYWGATYPKQGTQTTQIQCVACVPFPLVQTRNMKAQSINEYIRFQTFSLPRVYTSNIRIEFSLAEKITTEISNCPRIVFQCNVEKLAEDAVFTASLKIEICGLVTNYAFNPVNVVIEDAKIQSIFFLVPVGQLANLNLFSLELDSEMIARGRIYYDV